MLKVIDQILCTVLMLRQLDLCLLCTRMKSTFTKLCSTMLTSGPYASMAQHYDKT